MSQRLSFFVQKNGQTRLSGQATHTNDLKTRQGSFGATAKPHTDQHSPEHTHTFHTPRTFENTNQLPSWPTVLPYLSQYPPDSRQRLSFSACAPHVFFNVSTHRVSRSFPCLVFQQISTAKCRVKTFPSYPISTTNSIAHSSF